MTAGKAGVIKWKRKKKYVEAMNETPVLAKYGEGTYRIQLNWLCCKGFRNLWVGYVKKLPDYNTKIGFIVRRQRIAMETGKEKELELKDILK